MKILKASQQVVVKNRGGFRAFVNNEIKSRWGVYPSWDVDKKAPPVYAWVNKSSWVADCECRGSMVVEPGEPYMCPDCGNVAHGSRPRTVVWPRNAEAIEEVLLKRPYPNNRNWTPGETITQLKAENKAHGLEE